jgi:hypothetical protein
VTRRIDVIFVLFFLVVTACAPAVATAIPTPKLTATTAPVLPPSTPVPVTLTPTASPSPTITATPHFAKSDYELVSFAIQAYQVDNGGRQANIAPDQVRQWVDKANVIFAVAGIRFLFDPQSDFGELRSTLINNMAGVADTRWIAEVTLGDQIAARHPGKLVVFFRYGPGPSASGEAFSWSDYNFVVMPGWDTPICGSQNIGMFAQAVGHYLGLPHTYAAIFKTKAEAEAFYRNHASNPMVFDGDHFSDTVPDPFIANDFIQCEPVPVIQIGDSEFRLPRDNVMSNYAASFEFSPQQIAQLRWMLALRMKNGMSIPTNRNAPDPIQAESLPITKQLECAPEVQNMSPWGAHQWNRDQQLLVNANNGCTLSLSLAVEQAGRYRLDAYLTYAPNFGQVQISLDGNDLGVPIDFYSPIVLPSGPILLGIFDLAAGEHTLTFQVRGKNENSPSYKFGLDAFSLTPAP